MATILERTESAKRAAFRANRLGKFVYSTAKYLFCATTAALPIAMFIVYRVNSGLERYWDSETLKYSSSIDWTSIWSEWGVLLGAWLAYSFMLVVFALIGAVAQAKAESLDLQITQAQP